MFIPIKEIYLPVGKISKIPTTPAIYMNDDEIHTFYLDDERKWGVGRIFPQRELLSVSDDGEETWGNVKAHYIVTRFDTQEEAIHFAHVVAACGDCNVEAFDLFCFNRKTGEYEDMDFEIRRHIKRTVEKRKNADQIKLTKLQDEKSAIIQMKDTAEAESKRWRDKACELAVRLGETESELRKYTQPIGA